MNASAAIIEAPHTIPPFAATRRVHNFRVEEHAGFFQRRWPLFRPMVALVLASLLIRWSDFDIWVSSFFFDETKGVWPYELAQPWLTIYRQGTIPSIVLGVAGLIVGFVGRWILPYSDWRRSKAIQRAGLFLGLSLAIGPGLIVNVGFKQLWGRPRPIQCATFNGDREFLPVGTWAPERHSNSSFPSGHAAVAFYLMMPGFVTAKRRPYLTAAFFLTGTALGLGMGLTRVIQGGHFVSDVLWAGALVYLTGAALSWIVLLNDGLTLSGETVDDANRDQARLQARPSVPKA